MVLINENVDIYLLIRQNNTFAVRVWLDNATNDIHQRLFLIHAANFSKECLYSSDEHGFTLLHWASWYGRLSIVPLLLQRGARVNAVNRGKTSIIRLSNLTYQNFR
jgi:integrin-linked kinase